MAPEAADPQAAAGALLPWQLVRVAGPSMVPTLRPGDLVLVHRGPAARPGDVVLARFADLPARPVLKRVTAVTGARVVLASDNRAAGGDSRTHGPAVVLGRVRWVIAPGRPRRVRRGNPW